MRKEEVERMRELLVEAITTLCRSGMKYNSAMRVEGLLGVTLDEEDIILVNVNKSYQVPKPGEELAEANENEEVDSSNGDERKELNPSPSESRTEFDDENSMFSLKREPPDDRPAPKRRKPSSPSQVHLTPVPTGAPMQSLSYTSRVPPMHPDSEQGLDTSDSSWTRTLQHSDHAQANNQNIQSPNHAADNTSFSELPPDGQDMDRNVQRTSSGHNVKIEISSESESEDTMYGEQSQFPGQDSSLYGAPIDMPGAAMFNPANIPGTSGEFSYSDTSFQDQSLLGTPSGSGKNSGGTCRYQCSVCRQGFAQKANMVRHQQTVHMGLRPYKCPYCPLMVGRKDNLKKHIEKKHNMTTDNDSVNG